ncbi:Hypothetical protein CINCED_3A020803 [Cinara cedri]|uniref:Uncharacterized protein n=1 Tax=Cinara cedri TaxID=506608 RepID=A0A5E4MQE4_9HEMI|nr:Hypothetical protein CINCED_3A020803 [Cinara cedri]
MQIAGISTLMVATVAVIVGLQILSRTSEASAAEGLTPFRFLMARAYGESDDHTVMRFIRFKPSDGAKFRETFEKKHGPRGRDLIESLGQGSYNKKAVTTKPKDLPDVGIPNVADGTPSDKSVSIKKPIL